MLDYFTDTYTDKHHVIWPMIPHWFANALVPGLSCQGGGVWVLTLSSLLRVRMLILSHAQAQAAGRGAVRGVSLPPLVNGTQQKTALRKSSRTRTFDSPTSLCFGRLMSWAWAALGITAMSYTGTTHPPAAACATVYIADRTGVHPFPCVFACVGAASCWLMMGVSC